MFKILKNIYSYNNDNDINQGFLMFDIFCYFTIMLFTCICCFCIPIQGLILPIKILVTISSFFGICTLASLVANDSFKTASKWETTRLMGDILTGVILVNVVVLISFKIIKLLIYTMPAFIFNIPHKIYEYSNHKKLKQAMLKNNFLVYKKEFFKEL